MTFGFGTGSGGDPDDLSSKVPLFAELQKLMSWSGGPVNWDIAKQLAIMQIAGDPAKRAEASPTERSEVTEAVQLADLWLDDVTDLPSGVRASEAWSALEWIEKTLPAWSQLCDPVAGRVSGAMTAALPPEVRQQTAEMGAGQLGSMMQLVGGLMFGSQVGQALGGLSGEVLTSTDIGLPLGPDGIAALLPHAVAELGTGLGRPAAEVRLYLALREAAHHRLFGHVPWLRQRLVSTVETYASGITVDTQAIERAMQELDPTNPESMQAALAGGMFAPEETPEQQAALRRLETLLALIEGWVDAVVTDAASDRLPGAEALRETLRRRRATGGPAEQTFATLVGLELRPRRLREAAALWTAVTEARGRSGRDALWAHPDLLPVTDDLDDPVGFATGSTSDVIAELTAEDFGKPSEEDPPDEQK